jgi:hypothetical protein
MSLPLDLAFRVLAHLRAHGARAAVAGTLAGELRGAPASHREIEVLLDAGGDAEVERLGLSLEGLGLVVVARTEDPHRGRIAGLLLAPREPGDTDIAVRLTVAAGEAESDLVGAALPVSLDDVRSLAVLARGHLLALAARALARGDAPGAEPSAALEALLVVSTSADLDLARETLAALDPAQAHALDALLRRRGPRWWRVP